MAANEPFDYTYSGNSDPIGAEPVTQPDDTAFLKYYSRYLWVGGAGNVSVTMMNGTSAILVGVGKGTMLKIRVARVNATGTTATAIVSLY